MSIEEEKIIQDIENESDGLRDYTSFVRYNSEFKYRRQQQKLFFATIVIIVYAVVALGALSIFRNNTSFLLRPFEPSGSQEMVNLQRQIDLLNDEVSRLGTTISTSTQESVSISRLDERMFALEESININPEKALTAVLIREQQKNLEINFKELKDSQVRLGEKVDSFITSVIIVPVIGFLLALIGWFIQVRFLRKEN